MTVKLNFHAVLLTTWQEYAIRFILGGAITVIAGIAAAWYGPVIGGIFLAFPTILPASATLLEKHEREKRQEHGLAGNKRAREVVVLDASGAIRGGFGLLIFAFLVLDLTPRFNAGIALCAASVGWLAGSSLLWFARKIPRRVLQKLHRKPS